MLHTRLVVPLLQLTEMGKVKDEGKTIDAIAVLSAMIWGWVNVKVYTAFSLLMSEVRDRA